MASTNICPLGIGQVFEDQDRSSRFSAQAVLQVFSAFVPSTSFCCFDILSTTVIVLCSWSSRLCHVSDAHGGCNLYPVVAFLFIAPSFSRPNSMFNSISVAVVFFQPFEPCHHFLSIGYRLRLCRCLYGFSLCLQFFTRSVRSPDLWLPFGFSVLLSRLRHRLRYLLCSLGSSSFPAQPGFLSASPFIPISAFLSSLSISGVLAAQPASSFLASVSSPFHILPPRLISDFLRSSQLLLFFNLYSLIMARLLLQFPVLYSSISSISRASVFRPPSALYRPLFLPTLLLPTMRSSI